MCSIGEDDFGDEGGLHTMLKDPKPDIHQPITEELCKKCNERKSVVKINLKDAQCEPCFYQYARHKFRAALGSTRIVDRGARVLLIFDGTIESSVMFDMIRYGLIEDQFKRITFAPSALYIDDTCTFETDCEKRQANLKKIMELLAYFQFETFYTSIAASNAVTKVTDYQHFAQPSDDGEFAKKEQNFQNTLNSIRSLTSRQEFVHIAQMNSIRKAAELLNCKYAFLPTVNHQIATNLLANIALGRGGSMANEISICDNRGKVKILRPIRTLSDVEIEAYVKFNKNIAWPTDIRAFANACDSNATLSLQNLTRQFVNGLQENFTSTVSTVFRTGDKISASATNAKEADVKVKGVCTFCHSILDYEDSPTLFAIEYSRCMSAHAGQSDVNDFELMAQNARDALKGKTSGKKDDEDDISAVWQYLCHGCRNIFRDFKDSTGADYLKENSNE